MKQASSTLAERFFQPTKKENNLNTELFRRSQVHTSAVYNKQRLMLL